MLNIEMAKLAVLAVILYVQVEGSFGSLEDDRDIWSLESWQVIRTDRTSWKPASGCASSVIRA